MIRQAEAVGHPWVSQHDRGDFVAPPQATSLALGSNGGQEYSN